MILHRLQENGKKSETTNVHMCDSIKVLQMHCKKCVYLASPLHSPQQLLREQSRNKCSAENALPFEVEEARRVVVIVERVSEDWCTVNSTGIRPPELELLADAHAYA